VTGRLLILYLVSFTSCSSHRQPTTLPVDTITQATTPPTLLDPPTIDPAVAALVERYDAYIAANCYDMPDGRKVFMGYDGLAAVADSCDEAFVEWKKLPLPKTRPNYKI
jgi:hypothetical protein